MPEREHVRLELAIEVTLESDHNFYTGLTSNISEGGLFVATHALQPIGARVGVQITLPLSTEPIHVVGEVRWFRDSLGSDLAPGMGLQFVELSDLALQQIQRFVKSRDTLFFEV